MKNNILKRLTEDELPAVAELESLCFSEPWSVNSLRLLTTSDAIGFVCIDGGHAVAYGGMLYAPFEGQITNVAVAPDARRQGFGRAILEALIHDANEKGLEQISLEVRESNEAAIALYQSFGFYTAGVRKNFYKHPTENGLVMLKPMKEER